MPHLLNTRLHLLPALLYLAAALGYNALSGLGLLIAALYLALVLTGRERLPEGIWLLAVLFVSLALVAHLLPGFASSPLWPARQLSPDAPPYALNLAWDKALVSAALLSHWLSRAQTEPCRPGLAALVFTLTLCATPLLALAIGLVAWQPKWPQDFALWLAVNVGVVVLAEELLFRGLLQSWLTQRLGNWSGLLLTAGVFGAVHLPWSAPFALVAGVAGLGYGLARHFSGRLSVAIALHGAVNCLHVLLLSYPLRVS